MKFLVGPSARLAGEVLIPASKSHTIRALFFAALADGVSIIKNPLDSADGRSAREAVRVLGARVEEREDSWLVQGLGGKINAPKEPVDVGNSGTTARFALSMASLGTERITITGDEQTRSRPMGSLLDALKNLGAETSGSNGKLPATVRGPLAGGFTTVDGTTSQYLSSLLVHAPLAPQDTVISLSHLNEKPYVDMTLRWLDRFGIKYTRQGYERFEIKGGQRYTAFDEQIPGDFSSATFFACMGAMPGNEITLLGLDMADSQGDKAVFDYIKQMGAEVVFHIDGRITVRGAKLNGAKLDLNSTPDALPAMAALAAVADGVTILGNVPQARIKETDRIAVMAQELGKMGIKCEETHDSLIVHGGAPRGANVTSHGDHRVVMSLAFLASRATGITTVDRAEAADITFPNFARLYNAVGGNLAEE
ncbi:MAG: 3-phosphoshikimate 1-carboxyvinyltransferase [Nitrospinae bacterium]|nr:3-phosphoshikimate 1-carboxyvinyltransferase [Nitrospinota bacterium]